jgi:hypothetical protein
MAWRIMKKPGAHEGEQAEAGDQQIEVRALDQHAQATPETSQPAATSAIHIRLRSMKTTYQTAPCSTKTTAG